MTAVFFCFTFSMVNVYYLTKSLRIQPRAYLFICGQVLLCLFQACMAANAIIKVIREP